MSRCVIGLGGNIGPTAEFFNRAIWLLQTAGYEVLACSGNYDTTPMGTQAGQQFLNAAAVLTTEAGCFDVLTTLHAIESELGRERVLHWGPRIIDLDLLLYDDAVIDSPQIVVPHPALWYRRFVLEPLNEIVPDWSHPILGESIAGLYQRLRQRPVRLLVSGLDLHFPGHPNLLQQLQRALGSEFQLQAEVSEQNDEPCFARIACRASATARHPRRNQPPHSADRTVEVFAENVDDLVRQFREFATAVLG